MPKLLLLGFYLITSTICYGQNVAQYFDDGIEDNRGLFISSNALQLLSGHKGITIEKTFSSNLSAAIELGSVNHLVNTYSVGNFINDESLLLEPKGGHYYGLRLAVHAKLFNNYGFFGLRFKNYGIELEDNTKTQMQQYDMLTGMKFLFQHHIFLQFFYGFGVRVAEQEANEFESIKTK